MEINIYNDKEVILFKVKDKEYIMSFDSLVELSEIILEHKNETINVNADGILSLYKETIEKLRDSLINDKELIDLLDKKNKKQVI